MYKGLVLYTDGGTHSLNPGPYGYGIHGYIYSFEKPKRVIGISGYVPTQLGYIERSDAILDPTELSKDEFVSTQELYKVSIDEIINIHGSNSGISTNNVAELLGMISGLG